MVDVLLEAIRDFQENRATYQNEIIPNKKWAKQVHEQGFYTIDKIIGMPQIDICLHFCPASSLKQIPLHNHDFYELVYVYKGQALQMMRDQHISLHQGDIVLMDPNTVHAIHVENETDCVINLLIKKEVLNESVLLFLKQNPLVSRFMVDYIYGLKKDDNYIFFPSCEEKAINRLLVKLIEELSMQDAHFESMISTCLIALFNELSRNAKEMNALKNRNEVDTVMNSVIAYIRDNLNTVTLKKVANEFHYSTSYISRLVYLYTGKRYVEVVHEMKLERAKQYIEIGELSIGRVAEMVGFNDASYLHRVFKKRYGLSPATYKKRNG
ncbi:helix-turn-helix transcriptional regulator [Ohessyouella blattaphilus]|uniref:AraC family transcriptional regulator n=1 Tax=Ohessyouella blattaphilus TaxID=2949333 RepID=A0ABT1EIB8_9FIRM|nr:AraC family transcriptional regulator [Ohessyouella blattaphilus]MCP1110441.1 AraC family transcriptional regulator [Ohessyouella blattaphilus]MCR8563835.1 AraC family transcriptional regulator [Ohessyouella blattaphilus]